MKKISVVYFSSTGNTEMMAEAIKEGASIDGVEVELIAVENADESNVRDVDGLALGCPAMGSEELDDEVISFLANNQHLIKDLPVVLFGSYDWGDGTWMEDWEVEMASYGAKLVGTGLIVNLTPDDDDLELCRNHGKLLVNSI